MNNPVTVLVKKHKSFTVNEETLPFKEDELAAGFFGILDPLDEPTSSVIEPRLSASHFRSDK